MHTVDLPWHGSSWQSAPDGTSPKTIVEWAGRDYDLTSDDDTGALVAEREGLDDANGAVMDAVIAAQLRTLDAEAAARRYEQQIAADQLTTRAFTEAMRASGMDKAQEHASQLLAGHRDPKARTFIRDNYGDSWRRSRSAQTADLATPAEPEIDEKTAEIRAYRRRHGI